MRKPILRELKTVTHQPITINLPNSWEAQEVKVIVMPRLTACNPGAEAWQKEAHTMKHTSYLKPILLIGLLLT